MNTGIDAAALMGRIDNLGECLKKAIGEFRYADALRISSERMSLIRTFSAHLCQKTPSGAFFYFSFHSSAFCLPANSPCSGNSGNSQTQLTYQSYFMIMR